MQKSLKKPGKDSSVEVQDITAHGIWLFVSDKEYFLSYTQFPWFKNATVAQICDVELSGQDLYWPDLDVDLTIDILERPEAYPLVYAS